MMMMKMMMMRMMTIMMTKHTTSAKALLLLILPVLLFSSGGIPGCTKKHEASRSEVTITFWHSFVASTVPALNELLRTFEEEHPGIRVKAQYVPTGDGLIQKLVSSVESETAPDVSWIHADFLDKLVESGALVCMDSLIAGADGLSAAELADIHPASLEASRFRGRLYALPMEATSLALFYNKELFRKAGLDPVHPPATWEELRRYARRLTVERSGQKEQYGFFVPVFPASGELNIWMILQWTPFLWQAGGAEFDRSQRRALFNSPSGVRALTFWKELYDDLDFSRFGLAHDLGFASAKLAMVMDGPWNLPRYRAMKNVEWAAAPLPAGPAGSATYVAGEQLAIFTQSRHRSEAWTFVKWILEPRVQSMFSMSSGYLPVRRSVLLREDYKKFLNSDPAMNVFVGQMEVGRARAAIARHRVEINRALAEAIEKATLGKMDPKQCLDEAAEKANALLDH